MIWETPSATPRISLEVDQAYWEVIDEELHAPSGGWLELELLQKRHRHADTLTSMEQMFESPRCVSSAELTVQSRHTHAPEGFAKRSLGTCRARLLLPAEAFPRFVHRHLSLEHRHHHQLRHRSPHRAGSIDTLEMLLHDRSPIDSHFNSSGDCQGRAQDR